jgi:uridine kinase
VTDVGSQRARVVVLTGPSGSGKSRLAGRLNERRGWPIFRLDDFYREGNDPDLPHRPGLRIPDWDDPRSWNGDAALRALTSLVDTGTAECPRYDISTSSTVGTHVVTCGPDHLIVAEGIFAAELIEPLRAAGLLHSAWCVVHRHRALTFLWRLGRDLKERRKPPHILLQRGWGLMRAEPELVRRQQQLGALPARATMVERTVGADR